MTTAAHSSAFVLLTAGRARRRSVAAMPGPRAHWRQQYASPFFRHLTTEVRSLEARF